MKQAPLDAARRDGSFDFSARLERARGGGPYYVSVPASVSTSIGRRGIVPVVALVNGVAEVRASIVPWGGGRHRRQNHIVRWVEEAVREATREKRIAKTVEVASEARERAEDLARMARPSRGRRA